MGCLHEPEEGRGEAQEEVGEGVVHGSEQAWRQHLRIVGNENVLKQHVAADCGAHPHRIPVAGEGHTRRVLGYLEIQGALDPGLVAKANGGGGVVGGAAAQGDEKLPPVDDIAAIHLPRGGAKAPAAHGEAGIGLALLHRLAVGLSVEGALLHDLAELDGAELLVALTRGGRHRHVIGDPAHHQHGEAVHVEGERRRGIALRKLLRHQAVGFVVGPEPAVAFGHAQAEEPLAAEIGIVVEGKGRVAVVAVGARGKALAGQTAGKIDQFALPGGRLKVHQGGSRAGRMLRQGAIRHGASAKSTSNGDAPSTPPASISPTASPASGQGTRLPPPLCRRGFHQNDVAGVL